MVVSVAIARADRCCVAVVVGFSRYEHSRANRLSRTDDCVHRLMRRLYAAVNSAHRQYTAEFHDDLSLPFSGALLSSSALVTIFFRVSSFN